jgi:hypothetical protein
VPERLGFRIGYRDVAVPDGRGSTIGVGWSAALATANFGQWTIEIDLDSVGVAHVQLMLIRQRPFADLNSLRRETFPHFP